MEENKVCPICGDEFTEWGNNPDPIKVEGDCCDFCNKNIVLPVRMMGMAAIPVDTRKRTVEDLLIELSEDIEIEFIPMVVDMGMPTYVSPTSSGVNPLTEEGRAVYKDILELPVLYSYKKDGYFYSAVGVKQDVELAGELEAFLYAAAGYISQTLFDEYFYDEDLFE